MNEAFVGVWFNIHLCYHKIMTSHMMRVTLVAVVVGGYTLVIHVTNFMRRNPCLGFCLYTYFACS